MTLDAGDYIWPELRRRLSADATPLLLDNTQDISQFTDAWLRANVFAMHEEAERILRSGGIKLSTYRIQAKQDQLIKNIGPGYAEDGYAWQLTDRELAGKRTPLTSLENRCQRKADDRATLVPPKGFVLPNL